jgi:hypothetical protein
MRNYMDFHIIKNIKTLSFYLIVYPFLPLQQHMILIFQIYRFFILEDWRITN